MNMPQLPTLKHEIDPNIQKADYIVRTLYKSNKQIMDEKDAIEFIEKTGIEKFNFDYPYGSFVEFKKQTLAGKFKMPEIPKFTEKQKDELKKKEKEGKIWVQY